jgi:twitching motility protein PilT
MQVPSVPDSVFPSSLFPSGARTGNPEEPGGATGVATRPEASPASFAAPAGLASMPATLEGIVRLANSSSYSDVHLGVGEEPRYRERGEMLRTGWPVTDAAQFMSWLREMLTPMEIDQFQRDKEYDGSYMFPFVRVRINLLETARGMGMVLRLIPLVVPTLDELDLPEILKSLVAYPKGLVLVTGPTGCGKSTTLAAMIDRINNTSNRHIITIEDPVEFLHTSRQCLIRQREVGRHTRKFHTALRAAMREDPDVILIGEIRDQETLATAMEAAQTGHLVFGTLHTNSAVKSVERVLGMFPPHEQAAVRAVVGESLLAVVSQGLLRRVDGGRIPYHDILINTDACRDYIQRGELDEVEQIMARSAFDGMHTINQALAELVEAGKVTPEDALAASLKRNELAQTLRGRQ